jgi:hypothetical protein
VNELYDNRILVRLITISITTRDSQVGQGKIQHATQVKAKLDFYSNQKENSGRAESKAE